MVTNSDFGVYIGVVREDFGSRRRESSIANHESRRGVKLLPVLCYQVFTHVKLLGSLYSDYFNGFGYHRGL